MLMYGMDSYERLLRAVLAVATEVDVAARELLAKEAGAGVVEQAGVTGEAGAAGAGEELESRGIEL